MANIKSAKKRIKINEKKRIINLAHKTKVKSYVKKAITVLADKSEKKNAAEVVKQTIKVIDTVAGKGVIHKNKAARLKSRLAKKVNKLAKASVGSKKSKTAKTAEVAAEAEA